ncbi:MAG: FAD-dependent oxidoreductase, partial [Planctomycetes bacterium]|nr:FAD-dependent oxidoreductase [Planctomycetota bacterium]
MANVLVVGAGISGCVASRMLAEKGYDVLLVDRRNHVGGNAYDARSAAGHTIHMHGPHVFHARDRKVWDFCSRFTDWRYYQHRVQTYVEGRYVPFPINQDTINELYGYNLDINGMNSFLKNFRPDIAKPK